MGKAHIIQVETRAWLVIDDVRHPRFLILYGPAVHAVTGETHMMYRVLHWQLEKDRRHVLAWHETYQDAAAWCTAQIEAPAFLTPATDADGRVITTDEQRRRWEAGLDPRTGQPRDR